MSITLPSLNWLRVFEAAARHESFARAARELDLSPAAVSQQVRALEDRLGRPLFMREAHAVRLTEAGRAYLPAVGQALGTMESATREIFGATRVRHLFVRCEIMFAQGLLAPGLAEFHALHPDIAVTLNTSAGVGDVGAAGADLEIVFGQAATLGRDSDPLVGETLYPVAHPSIARAIKTADDLSQARLINIAPHRTGWIQLLGDLGLSMSRVRFMHTDDTVTAMALAREGLGVALARAPASDRAMQDAGLVPCLSGVAITGAERYHLVTPDAGALRAPARAFRRWCLDWSASLHAKVSAA